MEDIRENGVEYKHRQGMLDIIRFLCALLVLQIHVPAGESFGVYVLTRPSVPIFFGVSAFIWGGIRRIKNTLYLEAFES